MKYKKIEFSAGQSIESAVNQLKASNELCCGSFNGKIIYSDKDDIDSAYKKIIGKTKKEVDYAAKVRSNEYEEQQRKHKEAIPKLTKEWIRKGKVVLDKKYHKTWKECVPIRLDDLYQGMELGMCLDIVKELNSGCDLDKAKDIIENQGHSGASFGLICSMIRAFCDRGYDFVKYLNDGRTNK